ncbi:hypothetical protein F2Q68_00027484 [Brassica cretica]|uniref:tryptophan--tRNA ligase n=1 Tax=Brassica cretica TaxID=69181 RepID=A0A8S9IKZ2_BRACR|nr:hypothetical protein F2Q68_00027484 [Brassica cretica]
MIAVTGGENASVSLLTYPVLMAADILLYKSDFVPVGEDQKQHLELARDLAQRVNNLYGGRKWKKLGGRGGSIFKIPEPLIPQVGARVMSLTDGRSKMSKSAPSDQSRINLLDSKDLIADKIKRCKTDSFVGLEYDNAERPECNNLLSVYQIVSGKTKEGVKIHCTCKRLFYGRVKKLQVVPVQGGKETKKLELTLTDTEDHQVACCLWGQVQITNAFDSSTIEINPAGFDVQDYLQVLPNNDLALTTGIHEVAKTQGNKRQPDKWSTYPERSILDIIMATESDDENTEDTLTNIALSDRSSGQVSFISIESEDTTCLSSTPLSKRKGNNEIDDLSSTSKKQCSKIIKVSFISIESEDTTCLSSTPLSKRKGNNEIDDLSSTSKKQCSKIIKVEKNCGEMKRKYQPPLGADGHRLCSKPQSKQRIDHKKNKDVPLSTVFARLLHDVTIRKVSSRMKRKYQPPLGADGHRLCSKPQSKQRIDHKKNKDVPLSTVFARLLHDVTIRKVSSSHLKYNKGIMFESGSIDECDDLEVESSSQDSSDTEISNDEQSTVQEPEKVDQSGRVNLLAALFKKTFSEVKTKAKAVSSKEDG